MYDGKNILLGVTGSIAAYKSAFLCRQIIKQNGNVRVILTKSAAEFITPLTFETLTGNFVPVSMFDRNRSDHSEIIHIDWARWADAIMIAPVTANFLAKIANGIADDLLSATILAAKIPIVFAPSMNTAMYQNNITQANIEKLRQRGFLFITPETGELACGETGSGRLAEIGHIVDMGFYSLRKKHLEGKLAVITAGATREHFDPVRFFSNPATGLMGFEMARHLRAAGAKVVLISGKSNIEIPYDVEYVEIETAESMHQAVGKYIDDADIFVSSAAVADWTPSKKYDMKRKKDMDKLSIEFERTIDILYEVGKKRREDQVIVGFALETDNLKENAMRKLKEKNLDMIVANPVSSDSGFEVKTNRGHIIHKNGRVENVDMTTKHNMAGIISDRIIRALEDKKPYK